MKEETYILKKGDQPIFSFIIKGTMPFVIWTNLKPSTFPEDLADTRGVTLRDWFASHEVMPVKSNIGKQIYKDYWLDTYH